jgi:hypothetical protein
VGLSSNFLRVLFDSPVAGSNDHLRESADDLNIVPDVVSEHAGLDPLEQLQILLAFFEFRDVSEDHQRPAVLALELDGAARHREVLEFTVDDEAHFGLDVSAVEESIG